MKLGQTPGIAFTRRWRFATSSVAHRSRWSLLKARKKQKKAHRKEFAQLHLREFGIGAIALGNRASPFLTSSFFLLQGVAFCSASIPMPFQTITSARPSAI